MMHLFAGSLGAEKLELNSQQEAGVLLLIILFLAGPVYLTLLVSGLLLRKKLYFNRWVSILFILSFPLACLLQLFGSVVLSNINESGNELTGDFLAGLSIICLVTGLLAAVASVILAVTKSNKNP